MADKENEGVPAWVHRWKGKLPDKLRSFVSESSAVFEADDGRVPKPQDGRVPKPQEFRRAASASDATTTVPEWGGGQDPEELQTERLRRAQAEIEWRKAADEASRLQSEVWGLKGEVARLHTLMKRLDISQVETSAEAEAAAEMFIHLAREASEMCEQMREVEAKASGRAASVPTPPPPPHEDKADAREAPATPERTSRQLPPMPTASRSPRAGASAAGVAGAEDADDKSECGSVEEISTESLETKKEESGVPPASPSNVVAEGEEPMSDEDFEKLQSQYMVMLYDELFGRLAAREGTLGKASARRVPRGP